MAWLLGILLLDEGVGDGLHAVLRADEHHRSAPAHHQAQLPRVLCELVLVVRVCGRRGAAVRQCGRWGEGRQAKLSPPDFCFPQSVGSFSGDKQRGSGRALETALCSLPSLHNENTALGRWTECSEEQWGEEKPICRIWEFLEGHHSPPHQWAVPSRGEVTAHGGELTLRDHCTMGKAELGCHSPLPDPKDNSSLSLPIPSWSYRDGSGWLWAWGCSGVRRGQKLAGPASWGPM